MANISSIARPYAKAILSIAKSTDSYAQWSKMLQFLAQLVSDPRVIAVLKDHVIASTDKAEFLSSVAPEYLSEQAKNLLKVLAYNKRLLIIPELYQVYEELRKELEQHVPMTLTLASDVPAPEMDKLRATLSAQFNGQVIFDNEIDASLIAGGKVKIGDRVFESSIKSNLADLYKHLTQ